LTFGSLVVELRMSLDDLIREIQAVFPADHLWRLTAAVEVSGAIGQVGDHLVSHFIDEARGSGQSWAAIGERLGISRQAVQKRYATASGGDGRRDRAPRRRDRRGAIGMITPENAHCRHDRLTSCRDRP
jgi:hypothetical protein